MKLVRIAPLPDDAIATAAAFYAEWVERLPASKDLLLIFPPADHTHRAWRLAVVQGLAREHAPARVNALAGGNTATVAAALAYLASADGVTGQCIPLADLGAGPVV